MATCAQYSLDFCLAWTLIGEWTSRILFSVHKGLGHDIDMLLRSCLSVAPGVPALLPGPEPLSNKVPCHLFSCYKGSRLCDQLLLKGGSPWLWSWLALRGRSLCGQTWGYVRSLVPLLTSRSCLSHWRTGKSTYCSHAGKSGTTAVRSQHVAYPG